MDTTNGTTPWAETQAGRKVQARLSDERTLKALDNLLNRIDTLEKAVGHLTTLMEQGPGLTAMVADMADEAYRSADASGVNIDTRLKNALAIAEKLTAPAMVEKLDNLLALSDQAPGLTAMVADMADEAYRSADARGVNIDQRLGAALGLAEKLTDPAMMEKLDGLLKLSDQMPGLIAMTVDMVDEGMLKVVDSGFDPKGLIEIAGTANTALTHARAEPPTKLGAFGMLRALSDPDRQKGLGFLMNFLKHFGKNI